MNQVLLSRQDSLLRIREITVACNQSPIGYEASNHYYYTPVDLLEKTLNCEQVIRELRAGAPIGAAKSNA